MGWTCRAAHGTISQLFIDHVAADGSKRMNSEVYVVYVLLNYVSKSRFCAFFLLSFQFEIRQLRAHLAQQDLDLVAEREAAMQIHHMWGKQSSTFQEVDGLASGPSERHRPARSREPGRPAGTRLL